MHQHDAHVQKYREPRTVFYSETSPGEGVQVVATYGVPIDKIAWVMLRLLEAKRMELEGTWRDDLWRLETEMDGRRRLKHR